MTNPEFRRLHWLTLTLAIHAERLARWVDVGAHPEHRCGWCTAHADSDDRPKECPVRVLRDLVSDLLPAASLPSEFPAEPPRPLSDPERLRLEADLMEPRSGDPKEAYSPRPDTAPFDALVDLAKVHVHAMELAAEPQVPPDSAWAVRLLTQIGRKLALAPGFLAGTNGAGERILQAIDKLKAGGAEDPIGALNFMVEVSKDLELPRAEGEGMRAYLSRLEERILELRDWEKKTR